MESEMLKQREQMIVDQSEQITKLQDICKELVEALEMQHRDWLEMYTNHWNEDREENIMPKVETVLSKAKELIK